MAAMRRTRPFARSGFIVTAWLLGGTFVPIAAVMTILGCCELPFHSLVHRAMPLCEMAATALAHHGGQEQSPAAPAPSRPDAKPTMDRGWRAPERTATNAPLVLAATLPPPAAQPSLRTLPIGAFRCDDDVGTRLAFVETLRL
jgi:hypothetical protein